jgi:putative acetyltransferase
MPIRIRQERPDDAREVASVVESAFADASVADFTDRIRRSPAYVPALTFVAEEGGELLGFTMLSEVELEGRTEPLLILTPMAVRPDRQREGIGAELVRAAVADADARGEPLVLVEGVPAYYPRFGFVPATGLGLLRPDERIPEAAWLALPLAGYDASIRGNIVYPDFFPGPLDA